MALSFGEAKGGADKEKLNSYKFKDGENRIRAVGGLLARLVYWVPNPQGPNDMPVECLAFNRNTEEMDSKEKDWVKEYYPVLKPSWAYASLGYDASKDDPELEIINWKKKLFGQVSDTIEDLGDPTDLDNGWDIFFTRKKTGPNTFNVEYTLNALRSSKHQGPVSDKMREKIKASPTIDELLPRITPEKQKEFLDKVRSGASSNDEVPEELKEQVEENMAAII